MNKITESRLRRMILEEIAAMDPTALPDAQDAAADEVDELELSSTISKKASTLAKAVKAFKEGCPEVCMGHVASELKRLEKTLTDMAKNPGNYTASRSALKSEPADLMEPEEEEGEEDLEDEHDDEELEDEGY